MFLNYFTTYYITNCRFFTSIPLVQCLENYGIYACGTIKANRRGFPTELKNPNLERGDAKQVQHENMVITVWNDNKPVRFCLSLYILYQYIFDQFFITIVYATAYNAEGFNTFVICIGVNLIHLSVCSTR